MKKYYITSLTTVYQDHFEEGEGDYVNEFEAHSVIEGETALDAVKTYFDRSLLFSFDEKLAEIKDSLVRYSNMVDVDNSEVFPTDKIYEDFKKGKATLYSAYTDINIYELVKSPINLTTK